MLTINHLPAVLSPGQSFQIVRENPQFTTAGDYSFELTLPLANCPENLAIFGPLHRSEISHVPLIDARYPARIDAPPLHLDGYVSIKSITPREVKVQFQAGLSALRTAFTHADGTPRYIDELPLGNFWADIWAQHHLPEETHQTAENTLNLLHRLPADLVHFMLYGQPNDLRSQPSPYGWAECVCYPIYSITDNAVSNPRSASYYVLAGDAHTATFYQPLTAISTQMPLPLPHTHRHAPWAAHWLLSGYSLAPQPYLCCVVEKILHHLLDSPLRPEDNALRQLCPRLFIAGARHGIEIARSLPHWTVQEFFDEIERTFDLRLCITGRTARLVPRTIAEALATDQVVTLRHILTDTTSEIDPEAAATHPSRTNHGYTTDTIAPLFALPDEVWQRATIKHFADAAQLFAHAASLTFDQELLSHLYLADDTQQVFALLQGEPQEGGEYGVRLIEVDHLGSRRPIEQRGTDTRTRIVPAQLALRPLPTLYYERTGDNAYTLRAINTLEIPTLVTNQTRQAATTQYSIWQDIDQSESTHSSPPAELLEYAYHLDGYTTRQPLRFQRHSSKEKTVAHIDLPLPVAFPLVLSEGEAKYTDLLAAYCPNAPRTDHLFSLRRQLSAHDHTLLPADHPLTTQHIDTRSYRILRFADAIEPDPTRIYHIDTRRYLCKKIELSFTATRIAPIKTGYFYEINTSPS